MALNRKKSPELLALLEEQAEAQRRVQEAEEAQKAKEAEAEEVARRNGPAFAGVLLDLCETLGVEPEHPRVRKGPKGKGSVEISTDPSYAMRLARVDGMLQKIIAATDQSLLDEPKLEDDESRDRRRDEREKSRRPGKDSVEPEAVAAESFGNNSGEENVGTEGDPMTLA